MGENISHPGPEPQLWDLRFFMLVLTFGLLWVYLVAQGATAFQLVSGDYRLGLVVALAIEIGEIAALIYWSSEVKSKIWSWQFGAVTVAAILSGIAQYLAADSIAGDKVRIELKIALSVGISALAILLGKSAGERFSAWQAEFDQWKTAEMEWKLAEGRWEDQRDYERRQAEESREYRREQREKRERRRAEQGKAEKGEIQPTLAKPQQTEPESLPDAYKQRLGTLDGHLGDDRAVTADEAFVIMQIGKSQGYRILSAGVSAGLLEKSGRKWKRGNGIREGISAALPPGTGAA